LERRQDGVILPVNVVVSVLVIDKLVTVVAAIRGCCVPRFCTVGRPAVVLTWLRTAFSYTRKTTNEQ